jgi:hypothetical protein
MLRQPSLAFVNELLTCETMYLFSHNIIRVSVYRRAPVGLTENSCILVHFLAIAMLCSLSVSRVN